MLQQEKPQDFVIATGKQYSVRQFLTQCFECLGIKIRFEGNGVNEVAIVLIQIRMKKSTSHKRSNSCKVSEKYFRPLEVNSLLGDSTKANKILGWKPKITFEALCKEMIESDCKEFTYE